MATRQKTYYYILSLEEAEAIWGNLASDQRWNVAHTECVAVKTSTDALAAKKKLTYMVVNKPFMTEAVTRELLATEEWTPNDDDMGGAE